MKPNLKTTMICLGAILVVAVLVWQGIVAHGAPDPTTPKLSLTAMALSSGVLVFREGLEAILVLAAITAGVVRNSRGYWRSILIGVGAGLAATVVTWVAVVAIISAVNAPELAIQAGTGLLAVFVLLVVMNWFFHKIYWTGWIAHHSKRKGQILKSLNSSDSPVSFGLALLGFTAIYREGFEVVLFLQDLRLKAGSFVVLGGASIGFALTCVVAVLTFAAHQKLPYKKMLVLTGVMLGGVLVVMVGESAQEMQQAGWLSTHPINLAIPDWLGTWFATFPNVEGLAAQALAALLVAGSYAWVRRSVPTTGSRESRPTPMPV
jgi:high-affinity iron transporter